MLQLSGLDGAGPRLPLPFGASVTGLQLAEASGAAPLPDHVWSELGQALLQHSLLVIRGQHGLQPADEMRIYDRLHRACRWECAPPAGAREGQEDGKSLFELYTTDDGSEGGGVAGTTPPEPDTEAEAEAELPLLRGQALPGFPAVTLLGHGTLEDHHSLRGRLVAAPLGRGCHVNWHADGAFHLRSQPPARLLQLHCLETPSAAGGIWRRGDGDALHYTSGATFFASSHAALQLLPPDTQTRARQLGARYSGFAKTQHADDPYPHWKENGIRPLQPPKCEHHSTDPAPGGDRERGEVLQHPLVVTHPDTGRELLYFQTVCLERLFELSSGQDLTWEESMALLERMWMPATHSSQVYVHQWAPGDVVLVDNIAMIHAVSPFAGWSQMAGQRRLLHRIGLESDWLPPRPAIAQMPAVWLQLHGFTHAPKV